jgi:hypothetical protein
MTAGRGRAAWLFGLIFGASACWNSAPDADQRSAFSGPPRAGFEPVSDVFHAHCGSLDCHGQVARNLRLYGVNGLRLSPGAVPGVEGDFTTSAEYDANYAAIVGLEPERIDQVVRESGTGPERLTVVRKALDMEEHIGGQAIAPGSDAERCVESWLASAIDFGACERGAIIARPVAR